MAHYTPIRDEDEYRRGIDVGGDDYVPPRAPASARKYVTVDRPAQQQTTTLRKASQGAQITRSRAGNTQQTRRGDDEVRYGSNFAARRTTGTRPRTSEDPRITTNIRRVDTSAPVRGVSRRGLIVGIVGAAIVGLVGGNAVIGAIHDTQLVMAQGPQPVRNLELVCGHSDSVANPTLLHVFIEGYTIISIETPGGQHAKDHEVVGVGLPTTGDVSKWDLGVVPVRVGSKQYQIEINVTGQGFTYHWLLIDSGQGYFVGVK